MINKFLKYFYTIKYLKFRQTFGRAFADFKYNAGLYNLPKTPDNLAARIEPYTEFIKHDPWNSAEDIKKNIFNFLNSKVEFGNEIDWCAGGQSHLWQYNLHYFDYIFLLEKIEIEKICVDWINRNKTGKGTGWRPYPLSLRIVNWIKADLKDSRIIESIYEQSAFLFRNLEFYHPGNHYLENAKALIFAGKYFNEVGEAKKWLQKGKRIFLNELEKQVLNDGVYFELTPMYHSIMMRGFLDVLNILNPHDPLYDKLKSKLVRMSDFLRSSTHPDGNITLFNDSAEEISPASQKLLNYFKSLIDHQPKLINKFEDSGYYIFQNDEIYLMIDGGSIGPDFLPAHSHADIFSFELSFQNKKIIVDTGIFKYEEGKERNYARSTLAHNTLSIDGISQVECWGSFRVARRYKPKNIEFDLSRNDFRFSGEFDGYSKLIGDNLLHNRIVTGNIKEKFIEIYDEVTGKGTHQIESYLHFHPDCKIQLSQNEIRINNNIRVIVFDGNIKLEDSWYSPRFGIKVKNQKLVIHQNSSLPLKIRYRIIFQ